jgi:hypothetical protein
MKLPKYIQIALFFLLTFVNISSVQGLELESDGNVDITAAITQDPHSTVVVVPSQVEIKEPAQVTVTILGGESEPLSGHDIQLVAPGLTFNQPTQPTNAQGKVVIEVYGTTPGTYKICARDITYPGIVIDILECDTLYVTPVAVPNLLREPEFTKGTMNTLIWDSLGSGYKYFIEASTNENFSSIVASSGWISPTNFTFINLVNEQMYFYRVKSRNEYGGQSTWSNVVFSVQDNEPPEIRVISISDVEDNNNVQWDETYEIEVVYKVEDNLSLENVDFFCIRQDGTKSECGETTKTGIIYTTRIPLSALERDESGNLFLEYTFCIEASDTAGNLSRECDISVSVPEWIEEIEDDEDDDEPEPVEEVPTDIGKIIKDFVDTTEINMDNMFGDLDDYTIQDIGTTTSIATITVGIGTLIGGLLYIPLYLYQLLLNLLTWLGLRKEGSPIGYVYDSSTKEPISQAIVRVSDEKGRLVWTDVTDLKGLFGPVLEDGKYLIKVSARDYEFPSKIVAGKSDYPLENVYHGEIFEVYNGVVPEFSIPLDPVEISWLKRIFLFISSRFKIIFKILSIVLFIFGLLFSIYAYSKTPTWFNLVILLLYVPAFIIIILGVFKKKDRFGMVKDENGKPAKGVSVGLEDVEYERIVARRITDGKGRYRFVVNKGKYEIKILDSEYQVLYIEKKKDKVLSDGSLLITRDIIVRPTKVEN